MALSFGLAGKKEPATRPAPKPAALSDDDDDNEGPTDFVTSLEGNVINRWACFECGGLAHILMQSTQGVSVF
jgi:hypothetical protein